MVFFYSAYLEGWSRRVVERNAKGLRQKNRITRKNDLTMPESLLSAERHQGTSERRLVKIIT
jgi:hypothetical protein